MTFSVTANPTPQELSEAVNYLLANFSQTMSINPNTGSITTANYGVVSYLYKYLQVRYADSYDGSVNFSNVSTDRLYYGIRNNDSATESTDPADYQWLPVTGGFGTTKFFWYNTTGGRQIETFIGPVRPNVNFVKDTGNAIDLDLLTTAAEDKTDPVSVDQSAQIQALEQAIGSIPQPQLGTLAPQNAENVAITGGAINGTTIGATTPSTADFSYLTVDNYSNLTPISAPAYLNGRVWYDNTQSTLAYYNDIANNLVHVGQEVQLKVLNNTGSTIPIGSPVYITSTSSGQIYPNVALAKADVQATSAVIGLTTQAIANGAAGYVTTVGILQPCNTGTFTAGQVLYLSPYSAGQLMNTIPPTGYAVRVGIVAYANTPNGSIYVRQSNSYVAAAQIVGQVAIANGGTNGTATPTAGAVPYGTGTAYAFTSAGTSGQVLTSAGAGAPTWATPTSGTITAVTATAPVASSGGSAPNISMAAATSSVNGYLTSTDWTTFNGKQPAGTYVNSVSGTAPIVSSGGVTPAISIPAATTSVSGYLTSTDWTTFNNKGSGTVTSVSGTTGRITSTGGTTPVIDLTSGIATAGTTGSATLIPVVTIDTYGRVTSITTAANPQGTVTSVTGTSPVVSSGGATPAISMAAATASVNGYLTSTDWTTFNNKGSGSVTSVTFTGGIISVATGTTTPAFTVAGTSGGIPYFASGTTWASSAALTQYGVVYGGGAGAAPVATAAGTTGQVLTATTSGAPTWAAPATSGTVTSVSVVSANGFAGTVTTATTTPAITLTTSITGLLKGNGTAISAAVANTDYVPLSTVLTKTADYTITNTDTWIINNKTGSALTLTFPAASSWTGRSITVKNMQAQLVNSASSNIVPIDSVTAGTAILLGVIGNWATMVSDGTNWVIMQAASNNNLLLE